jgi:hypothetical protein
MRRLLTGLLVLFALAIAPLAFAAERWVHVKVDDGGEDGERVRVNLPLSLAEKVLPTINSNKLHNGKVKVKERAFEEVDLHALLDAVRTAPDNEYVTVESAHDNVRVAKSGGFLLIKVRETGHRWRSAEKTGESKKENTVDIKVPFTVVNALLSGEKDELDLLAAIRVLKESGDLELVTVKDGSESVRIWIDSRNTAD